jgi:hypothetical protein
MSISAKRILAAAAAGALALVLGAAAPAPATTVGPPWISVEYPANPYDRSTRDAFLLVHAFHHGTPTQFPIRGTAEGLVGGRRRSVTLDFEATSRPGVYALRRQWGAEGVWTLVISVAPDQGAAQALVEIAATGEVTAVRVPTRRIQTPHDGEMVVPRPVTAAEVDASLKARG